MSDDELLISAGLTRLEEEWWINRDNHRDLDRNKDEPGRNDLMATLQRERLELEEDLAVLRRHHWFKRQLADRRFKPAQGGNLAEQLGDLLADHQRAEVGGPFTPKARQAGEHLLNALWRSREHLVAAARIAAPILRRRAAG